LVTGTTTAGQLGKSGKHNRPPGAIIRDVPDRIDDELQEKQNWD
jgi:hypothetical protein